MFQIYNLSYNRIITDIVMVTKRSLTFWYCSCLSSHILSFPKRVSAIHRREDAI